MNGEHDRLHGGVLVPVSLTLDAKIFDLLTTAAMTDCLTRTEIVNRAIEMYARMQELPADRLLFPAHMFWTDANGKEYKLKIRKTYWRV